MKDLAINGWSHNNDLSKNEKIPSTLRVSLGTAILLELIEGKQAINPTTVYLMTHIFGKCTANCSFCPQAKHSKSKANMLSRITWPVFSTTVFLKSLKKATKKGKIQRICLQVMNQPNIFDQVLALVVAINSQNSVPISISCQPITHKNMVLLANAGVDRIGIPLDAATPNLFGKIKGKQAEGPYDWNNQFRLLQEAVTIFGEDKVSTHLIVGLGENEKEMVETIQKCVDIDVLPALFAFTPIKGTKLSNRPQPAIEQYQRLQLARYLIHNQIIRKEQMKFSEKGKIRKFGIEHDRLEEIINSGEPFTTSGCPGCNRPYYNEKPSGPIYNYPRPLRSDECSKILRNFEKIGKNHNLKE